MASTANLKSWGLGVFVAISATVLIWFGTGLHPFWPLMWLAPLPILWFSTFANRKDTALVAFIAMLLGGLNLWHYFNDLGVPIAIRLIVIGVKALIFLLAILLFRELLVCRAPWSALISFPSLWVSVEWLQSIFSPHGTFGSLAYSQINFLVFLQTASLTGPWGMSFLILLFSAAIVVCAQQYKIAPKRSFTIAVVIVFTMSAVLLFGFLRLTQPLSVRSETVGLIASDGPNIDILKSGAATEKLFFQYLEQAEKLAARGVKVIVLPEKLGIVVDEKENIADKFFQPFVDRTDVVIVVGVLSSRGGKTFNEARVYRSKTPPLFYQKHHMLPPFESELTPGISLTHFELYSFIWGVAICKDMDFTDLSRSYGNAAVSVLLVPAWDFKEDWILHGHMAIMRGVESGFSVVRAAKGGSLYASDGFGRIIAEIQSDSAPFSRLIVEVPVNRLTTLYQSWCDWFAGVALISFFFSIVSLIKCKRKIAFD